MANPFTFYTRPQHARDHQSNANWATYERMRADDELREYDRAKMQAPASVIADAHTARWVEREMAREAHKARAAKQVGR